MVQPKPGVPRRGKAREGGGGLSSVHHGPPEAQVTVPTRDPGPASCSRMDMQPTRAQVFPSPFPLILNNSNRLTSCRTWYILKSITPVCILPCYYCLVAQSCLTESPDCSPPGLSVHGILQARMLEWVAAAFSSGSSWPRNRTCVSCVSCIGRWILYHWTTWETQCILPRATNFGLFSSSLFVFCLSLLLGPPWPLNDLCASQKLRSKYFSFCFSF